MSLNDLRVSLLIVLQAGLLRMITPNIRGVTCAVNEQKIQLKFVYEGPYSEEDEEDCDDVATEVIAYFPDHQVDLQIVSMEISDPIDGQMLGDWAYLRKE
ncbi:hypothetical protein [Denitrobaculum tricleocarpae]|uniref:Uncharacterized protein n=1 Tax=Denitrobaculum tricleocarpae TaxID=2591009 RepID=A0A545TUB6_9PROT|nr:hypothetical protein [Denitrobaculum tricleocarpae]TQV80810.1 hypothetical protein FKG95_11720 [Denitrobaculum tricleocarpae]